MRLGLLLELGLLLLRRLLELLLLMLWRPLELWLLLLLGLLELWPLLLLGLLELRPRRLRSLLRSLRLRLRRTLLHLDNLKQERRDDNWYTSRGSTAFSSNHQRVKHMTPPRPVSREKKKKTH